MSLTLNQVIPDGTYRFQSVSNPGRYFDYQDNGRHDVRPMPSSTSDTQKWIVKGNTASGAANTYVIQNVASKLNLSFRSDTDKDGKPIWRLSAFQDGSNWTIEPRGSNFVIGWESNEKAIDYSDGGGDDWLLIWDRNNQNQQRWLVEPVIVGDRTPVANYIKVVNSSRSDIEVRMTKTSNTSGSTEWYTIASGANDTWSRSGSEDVVVRIKGSGTEEPGAKTSGVYAASGSVVTVIGVAHPGIIVTK
jgi:hypothetical protein